MVMISVRMAQIGIKTSGLGDSPYMNCGKEIWNLARSIMDIDVIHLSRYV